MTCKYLDKGECFDYDFDTITYSYCSLFDEPCSTVRRKRNCIHHLKQQIKQLKQENKEQKELNKALTGHMDFCINELELRLGNEIKRNEFLLNQFKRADQLKDEYREKLEEIERHNNGLHQV